MKRAIHVFLASILLMVEICFNLTTHVALAQNSPLVTEVVSTYSFGSTLQITAHLVDGIQPAVIYIVLQPEGQTSRQVKLVTSGNDEISFTYDLQQDPLKPFSRIYYWYQFELLDGTVQTSPSYWLEYTDNRYEWKNISTNLFEVYWTEDEASFGQKMQDIARQGLERATQILPIAPTLPIRIYVYPDADSLQDTLLSTHQKWAAGHASPELGVILVSNASDQTNLLDLERQISHELMHILQYQVAGSTYQNAPAWLLEGLASYAQTYPDPDTERILAAAYASNTLLSLDNMCQSFPIDAVEANIGYAQAGSVVEYMENHFGAQVFPRILARAGDGLSCSQLLEETIGLSPTDLEEEWKISTFEGYKGSDNNHSWGLLVLIAIVVIIVIIILLRDFKRRKQEPGLNG